MKLSCAVSLLLIALNGSTGKAADDPRAAQLKYEPWGKSCLAKSCFVGIWARGACMPSGGGVVISVDQDSKSVNLGVNFSTRRRLGAFSIQIDQDDPIAIPDPTCDQYGCRAKLQIDDAFIERLKRSKTIAIEATDAARQKTTLSFALADFANVYDGPGFEPKAREEVISTEEMKERVRRWEEERKAFECRDTE